MPQRPLPSPLSSVPSSRSAFTLIEMLVVVSILVILAAVTVPNVRPALESRRVREAARSVEAYLNRARIDAIERGQPVGVEFVRASGQPEACVQLRQVVAHPIYTGESESAFVQVAKTDDDEVSITPAGGAIDTSYVKIGDLIQFGSRGWNPLAPTYKLTGVGSPLTATLKNSTGVTLPWPTASPYPYVQFAIYRQPTSASAASIASAVGPLQLPESLCIDLFDSGTDDNSSAFAPTSASAKTIVMFGPNGTVKEVLTANTLQTVLPTERLYFLIGRRDRLPATPSYTATRGPIEHEDTLDNWGDLNNLWVTIVPRTGMAVTVENSFSTTGLPGARALARTAQSMGGR